MIFLTSTQMNCRECLEPVHTTFPTLMIVKNLIQRIQFQSNKNTMNLYSTKYIEQDVALSNPVTQPHQTYLDVVQWQDKIKHEGIKANRGEDTQKFETDNWITQMSSVSHSPIKLPSKQQSSTDKCWSENTSIPTPKSSDSQLPLQIISEEIATENPWMKVEQTFGPIKSQQVEPTSVHRPIGSSHGRSKQTWKPPDVLIYNKLKGSLAGTTELIQTEEPLVDDLTIQHIANQCRVYFASYLLTAK